MTLNNASQAKRSVKQQYQHHKATVQYLDYCISSCPPVAILFFIKIQVVLV